MPRGSNETCRAAASKNWSVERRPVGHFRRIGVVATAIVALTVNATVGDMAELWTDLAPGAQWSLVILAGALLTGAVGLMYQRIGKRLDARAERAAAASKENDLRPATHSKEGERFLLRMAHGPQQRKGPDRWRFTYSLNYGQYELENTASDIAHDVKIDVFTSGLKPEMMSSQTIVLSRLPPGLPALIPLGAPSRAKNFILCVRWDDLYGKDQLERFRVASVRNK